MSKVYGYEIAAASVFALIRFLRDKKLITANEIERWEDDTNEYANALATLRLDQESTPEEVAEADHFIKTFLT